MSGSVLGKQFTVTTWGESHGKAIGAVIDGCPAGLALSSDDIQADLDRRRPGASAFSSPRKEDDKVEILSGVFEGITTGAPISLIIYNSNQKSKDYSHLAKVYRPGHADYGFDSKYGFRDYRGGGRSSGRETASRVAAGAVARKVLRELGIEIYAYTLSIGQVTADKSRFSLEESRRNPLCFPDAQAYEKAAELLEELKAEGDSAGGVIECVIEGLEPGIGEPVFDKLDASLGKAMFSIGGVKGVEIGDGFEAAQSKGSMNNDAFFIDEENKIKKRTNHSGGVLGGMSDGSPVIVRVAVKPTPSINKKQKAVDSEGRELELSIGGRHDPVIVPRAVVVAEAMAALTLTDLIFQNMYSRMENVKE